MQPQPTFRGGEGGGAGIVGAHVSHHSVAQALNASRPRWRPRQVPRRISSRFSAARSRASSGVSTVLPPLGAVVESPRDEIAVAALAPAHRPHQGLPEADWRAALSGPGRRGAEVGRWAALAGGHDSRDGRERLGLFSLDNVTAGRSLARGPWLPRRARWRRAEGRSLGTPTTRHRIHRIHRNGSGGGFCGFCGFCGWMSGVDEEPRGGGSTTAVRVPGGFGIDAAQIPVLLEQAEGRL
jgi:hypothetical protein